MPAHFQPSRHAFGFRNDWPNEPALNLPTPWQGVGIGNAARGLCGGMVFGALDYWHAGVEPPAALPAPGEPLFRFIVWRLIQSWHVPTGVARYYYWMNLPDGDTVHSRLLRSRLLRSRLLHSRLLHRRLLHSRFQHRRLQHRRGLRARSMATEWPRIRARLDVGQPTPIGLVTVAGASPFQLGRNHQVLAYGYEVAGTKVTLHVYDPNSGPNDDVHIRFDTQAPDDGFAHSINIGLPVRGFFLTPYSPANPP